MKRFLLILSVLLFIIPGSAKAEGEYAMLETLRDTAYSDRFYKNPSGLSGIGDPFILKEGDTYYCYATGGGAAKGFYVWKTKDLSRWSAAERTLAFPGTDWGTANYWAPEVHRYQGKYVMLYSAQRGKNYTLRIGIAFSDRPEGPFVDPVGAPLIKTPYCAIDAHLFMDDDGTPYLFYVRDNYDNYIKGRQVSQTYGVRLSDDLLTPVGEPVLLTTPENDWELKSGHYIWNEGVSVLKNDGKYYLYFSANYTSTHDYCVGVAVAESPLGPYVKPEENPLLGPAYSLKTGDVIVSGPGHNSFFRVGGELFTSYHVNASNKNPTMNRTLCFDRAGFHADGTAYINGVSRASQLLPLKDIGLLNAAGTASVSSDGDTCLLTDGDYCISPASGKYLWRGTTARFAWEQPVLCDMIMIYPQRGAQGTGRAILNETYAANIDLASIGTIPGAAFMICFAQTELSSCRIEWDVETALGEVLILAHEKAE